MSDEESPRETSDTHSDGVADEGEDQPDEEQQEEQLEEQREEQLDEKQEENPQEQSSIPHEPEESGTPMQSPNENASAATPLQSPNDNASAGTPLQSPNEQIETPAETGEEPDTEDAAGTPVHLEVSEEEAPADEEAKPSRSMVSELLGLESSDEEENDGLKKPSKLQVDSDGEAEGDANDWALGEADEGNDAHKTVPGDATGPEEPPQPEVPPIEAEMPRLDLELGDEMHLLRLPNFLSIEPHPFHPATYADEAGEEALDEEGRMRLKLRVENTIRWRFKRTINEDGSEGDIERDELGEPVRESNARVVKWSDGSLSLHLGDEIFDVHVAPLAGNFEHLFVRQGNGLVGVSIFRTKLGVRPHSTDSQTHKKVTLSLAERGDRSSSKVRFLGAASGTNPELKKRQLQKDEDERERALLRREAAQRRVRERNLDRRREQSSGSRAGAISATFLEGASDEEADDVVMLKSQIRPSAMRAGLPKRQRSESVSADSDAVSDEDAVGRKRRATARVVDDDEDL